MNAYLVYFPVSAVEGNRDHDDHPGLMAFLRRLRAAGIATERGSASGVMPFAYLAAGDVANVVCRDQVQLLELLDGIEGAMYLPLGAFYPADLRVTQEAPPCDVTAAA